jgi:hypothetical protein
MALPTHSVRTAQLLARPRELNPAEHAVQVRWSRSRRRASKGHVRRYPGPSRPHCMDSGLLPPASGPLRVRHCAPRECTARASPVPLCGASGAFLRLCRGVRPWRQNLGVLSPQQPCPGMAVEPDRLAAHPCRFSPAPATPKVAGLSYNVVGSAGPQRGQRTALGGQA